MRGELRDRLRALVRRTRRFERRELHALRHWLERTTNLVHLSALVLVPTLIGLVTYLANSLETLSFLLFPPLASGAYMLFANPEGQYASPIRFVGGLTSGALCGWIGISVAVGSFYPATPGEIHAAGAALSVFLTGLTTWVLDIEEPAAYSTALLTLFVYAQIDNPQYYVFSVAVSSAIVAGAFAAWRRWVYEQRAEYLYESTSGDDHVLVPMRGADADGTAMLGARIASAHRAGKVVLLDVVDEEWMARAERELLEKHGETRLVTTPGPHAEPTDDRPDGIESLDDHDGVSTAVARLEERASDIETRVGIPCEVVVAAGGSTPAATVLQTAREANCDLIAAPYETRHGSVTSFVRELFRGEIDVLVHRSSKGRTRWKRILVPVRSKSGAAHSMIDFATRLAGRTGRVSVGTCISSGRERRRAEERLATLVETFEGNIETRVSQTPIERFLVEHGHEYDLVIIGASHDRSAASRLIAPPTFERIDSDAIEADIAIVDRS
jgi:nucleotide-binding universal stress UspA family protein